MSVKKEMRGEGGRASYMNRLRFLQMTFKHFVLSAHKTSLHMSTFTGSVRDFHQSSAPFEPERSKKTGAGFEGVLIVNPFVILIVYFSANAT
jgi:hypothetical protein